MRKRHSPQEAPPRGGADALRLDEAVDLAHALVVEAAEQVGARVLFIKGRTYEPHGLRPPRSQADVDVMVDPAGFHELLTRLQGWGWYLRMGEFTDFPLPHHSVTLMHDSWPCDIDVHHRFPGFLGDPSAVFEELIKRRETMLIAGMPIPVPDFSSSVLVMALHSVRSAPDEHRPEGELRRLRALSEAWDLPTAKDLAHLAAATKSATALESLLPLLGVEVLDDGDLDPATLRRWRETALGHATPSGDWMERFRSAAPQQKLKVVRDALWPPESFMRASRPIGESRGDVNQARLRRLVKGITGLPRDLGRRAGRQHPALREDEPPGTPTATEQ